MSKFLPSDNVNKKGLDSGASKYGTPVAGRSGGHLERANAKTSEVCDVCKKNPVAWSCECNHCDKELCEQCAKRPANSQSGKAIFCPGCGPGCVVENHGGAATPAREHDEATEVAEIERHVEGIEHEVAELKENGEVVAVCYKCKTPLTEGSKCQKCGYLNTKENAEDHRGKELACTECGRVGIEDMNRLPVGADCPKGDGGKIVYRPMQNAVDKDGVTCDKCTRPMDSHEVEEALKAGVPECSACRAFERENALHEDPCGECRHEKGVHDDLHGKCLTKNCLCNAYVGARDLVRNSPSDDEEPKKCSRCDEDAIGTINGKPVCDKHADKKENARFERPCPECGASGVIEDAAGNDVKCTKCAGTGVESVDKLPKENTDSSALGFDSTQKTTTAERSEEENGNHGGTPGPIIIDPERQNMPDGTLTCPECREKDLEACVCPPDSGVKQNDVTPDRSILRDGIGAGAARYGTRQNRDENDCECGHRAADHAGGPSGDILGACDQCDCKNFERA